MGLGALMRMLGSFGRQEEWLRCRKLSREVKGELHTGETVVEPTAAIAAAAAQKGARGRYPTFSPLPCFAAQFVLDLLVAVHWIEFADNFLQKATTTLSMCMCSLLRPMAQSIAPLLQPHAPPAVRKGYNTCFTRGGHKKAQLSASTEG